MITAYRIPMITDPVTAGQVGDALASAHARIDQAKRILDAYADLITGADTFLEAMSRALDSALEARKLFALTDDQLADRGILRENIPALVWKRGPQDAMQAA
jgi:hypothetical protein